MNAILRGLSVIYGSVYYMPLHLKAGVFGDTELKSVWKTDSVTLNSDFTEIKDDDVIQWGFGNTLIAEINVTVNRITVYDDVLDGRFRDRLKLDNQTGSLTITNITTEHAGDYVLLITRAKPLLKTFRVSVYDSVYCCGSTEAVIRLVLSALVGVATVILLVYDIRSRRAEQHQAHIHTSEINLLLDETLSKVINQSEETTDP
ncbi:hypothetical protein DPX16_2241 [Anabarilius grahami]|uniref:Immunoglobulin subtype domain-containing protein n=1 Tax=Anabarilius grahami TaxID=495550 RepID=A0A3N0YT61_ANAGA|nr:hypothetical protein DPX16_2241 [Anabarilius grahami]